VIGGAVVDASVALSWVLPGEQTEQSLRLREQAVADASFALLVPPIFWYEVANVLCIAVRRKKLGYSPAAKALQVLQAFAFEIWDPEPSLCLELAFQTGLSVYDSAYLQLALGAGTPLWTLDKSLASAASAMAISVKP
jgi:predicted nucleic acid-binding protein